MKYVLILLFAISFGKAHTQDLPEELPNVFPITIAPLFNKECAKLETEEEREICSRRAIQQYMANVTYPSSALENEIQGTVFVSFVVAEDASIINITLEKGADKILNDAAIAHLKEMPSFYSSGFSGGNPTRVKYSFPINFKLEESYAKVLTKKELKKLKRKTQKKLRALKKK